MLKRYKPLFESKRLLERDFYDFQSNYELRNFLNDILTGYESNWEIESKIIPEVLKNFPQYDTDDLRDNLKDFIKYYAMENLMGFDA
jgi:hypothetical protein